MNEFFHVSRLNLKEVSKFFLNFRTDGIECLPLFSDQEFTSRIKEIYPEGISRHGESYIHNTFILNPKGERLPNNEFYLEASFELVRRLKFPTYKSRFEVSFGCLTLEDAQFIKNKTFEGNGRIFRVACNNFRVLDMNWLLNGGCIIGTELLAEKYWSGKATTNPFWEVLMENPVMILEEILD